MEHNGAAAKLLGLSDAKSDLLAAIIGLVRTSEEHSFYTEHTITVLREALNTLKSLDDAACARVLQDVWQEKADLAPNCANCESPCGRMADYPKAEFSEEDTRLQEMKANMLFDIMDSLDALDLAKDFERIRRRLYMFGYEKDPSQFEGFLRQQ